MSALIKKLENNGEKIALAFIVAMVLYLVIAR